MIPTVRHCHTCRCFEPNELADTKIKLASARMGADRLVKERDRATEELATLKREHAQLRAVAERLLRFYDGVDDGEIAAPIAQLRAALDSTTAEPARETPTRHTYTLRCNGYADCTADQRARGCAECTRDSERK